VRFVRRSKRQKPARVKEHHDRLLAHRDTSPVETRWRMRCPQIRPRPPTTMPRVHRRQPACHFLAQQLAEHEFPAPSTASRDGTQSANQGHLIKVRAVAIRADIVLVYLKNAQ
jgi:hypothetical protein